MFFDQGRIFRDFHLPGLSPTERTAVYVAAVEVLAKLHSLDLASLQLEGFGKGPQYCKRQVRWHILLNYKKNKIKSKAVYFSFVKIAQQKVREMCFLLWRCPSGRGSTLRRRTETFLPWTSCPIGWRTICLRTITSSRSFMEISAWTTWYSTRLRYNVQALVPERCVFQQLNNPVCVFVSKTRVIAVLDWELSTTGNPLVDLAYFLMPQYLPANLSINKTVGSLQGIEGNISS